MSYFNTFIFPSPPADRTEQELAVVLRLNCYNALIGFQVIIFN